MRQGSTPTIYIKIPIEIPISSVEAAVFSIAQFGVELITKTETDMTVDEEKNLFAAELTQEDTLLLRHDTIAEMQLKVKVEGKVIPTDIVKIPVTKILNREVI